MIRLEAKYDIHSQQQVIKESSIKFLVMCWATQLADDLEFKRELHIMLLHLML